RSLSAPIIAVMALFYGVDQWNNYFDALIYLKDRSLYPLQMVLREILVMQEMTSTDPAMTEEMASAFHSKQELAAIIKYGVMIVSTLPVIIVYPFLHRFFVKGVMIGSLKGEVRDTRRIEVRYIMEWAIMTFNIRIDTKEDGENAWGHRKLKVIECIETHQPDLLSIQEASYEMMKELSSYFTDYDWIGQGREGANNGEFNAILYKKNNVELL